MPIVQKFLEQNIGRPIEHGVDPMESVATGAAVQGGVLAGEVKDVVLLDVTPLSLGVETLGGVASHLIERNTTIPTHKSQIFTTAADSQSTVEIKVYQGERTIAADNVPLGSFLLTGIPPAPRGIPQVEVSFDIDANGILNVSAKDLASGRKQGITITASNKLSKDEVAKMVHQAEEFAEKDRERAELIQARNAAESLAYEAERVVTDQKEKISPSEADDLREKVKALRAVIGKSDASLRENPGPDRRTHEGVACRGPEALPVRDPAGRGACRGSSERRDFRNSPGGPHGTRRRRLQGGRLRQQRREGPTVGRRSPTRGRRASATPGLSPVRCTRHRAG